MKSLILVLMLTTFVFAKDFLVINGFSHHLKTNIEYINGQKTLLNEHNFGLGFEREYPATNLLGTEVIPFAIGQGFIDSYNTLAVSLGGGLKKRFNITEDYIFDLGVTTFAIYKDEFNGIVPGILPFISFGTEDTRINLTYIPDVNIGQDILFMNLSVGLWD